MRTATYTYLFMKNLWLFIKHNFYPLLIIAIGALLCTANYTPNTILSGWDTLHPEFNFSLSFERMLNGVWRYDQGLGSIAIHSHMAELPRVIFLWLLSVCGTPTSLLRYAYFFLMLIVGPVGVYFLTLRQAQDKLRGSTFVKKSAAFIAGLAYLCNLGTLQHFIVPLEMFATLYGLFPWLILSVANLIDQPSKKRVLTFFILSLFASSMAHTATLFYAYAFGMGLFATTYAILKTKFFIAVKRLMLIFILLLCSNAYWMFPNIYTTLTHGQDIQESKVNQLFSPEAFTKNQAFGTVDNAVIFKNFLFDWTIYNPQENKFDDLMAVWKQHLATPGTQAIGYFIFGIGVVGILTIFVEFLEGRTLRVPCKVRPCKNVIGFALIPVFLLGFLALLSGTWPVTILFEQIKIVAPVAGEALRFPFTKFSILAMVPFALFVGIGFQHILMFAKTKFLQTITIAEMTLVFFAFFLPAFTGHLIHPAMRIQIPNEYFQMFEWFSKQNKTDRVAILPIHTFWNWTYYDWGYQGAGFLQFGIPQPILDRDYDRWNVTNETYQKEMSYAVYSQQPDLIRQALDKYDVRWVLLDTSVIAPGDNKSITFTWRLPELLEQAGLTKTQKFGDAITIYSAPTQNTEIIDVTKINSSPDIIPSDGAFSQVGPYTTLSSTRPYLTKEQRLDRFTEPIQGEVVEERKLNGYEQKNTFSISFPTLSHENAYVASITSNNKDGFPMQLCISNDLTKHCELFTRLHWGSDTQTEQFLIPPFMDFSSGYTLNFKNDTIGKIKGNNIIQTISISQINWPIGQTEVVDTIPTYVFSQSFDEGWHAYMLRKCPTFAEASAGRQMLNAKCQMENKIQETFPFLFEKELENHILVNNWSNGWLLQSDQSMKQLNTGTIVIFFLPQLLEWFGFALLVIPLIFILRMNR
jgi:hypothetical protein